MTKFAKFFFHALRCIGASRFNASATGNKGGAVSAKAQVPTTEVI
jgi:hypothetical protein